MRTRTPPDERGSALILAMAMLIFVAVIEMVSLSYAGSSLSSSNLAILPARVKADDASSAIQTAIRYVAADRAAGGTIGEDLGLACPTQTLSYSGASGSVGVAICPRADSLIRAGGVRAALLALGTDATEGIVLTHNGDGKLSGPVFSNSILSLAASTTLHVTGGPVWAWGNCTLPANVVIANPASSAICNASVVFGGTRPKVALDPADPSLGRVADWQPASTTPSMTQATIPACSAGAATLVPGTYFDPAPLSALTTSCAAVTLSPGVYVLDFPSSATAWSISQTVTAACDGTGQGAQLIFGNQSKLSLTGKLNIPCGRSATAGGPKIALYGLKSALGGSGATTTVLRPTTATDTGATKFYDAATLAAATPSGSTSYPRDAPASNAKASIAANNKTTELTLSGFAVTSGSALAASAQLSSVVVRVAHDESATMTFLPVPRLVWGTCSANLTATPTVSTTSVLYTSSDIHSTFSSCVGFDPTSALSVVWDVKTTAGGQQTTDVDGAEVAVTWSSPAIPAQSGCLTTVGGCSVVDPGASSGELDVRDVVYMPQNLFSGAFNLTGSGSLGSALIVRAVNVDIKPTICATCNEIGTDPSAPLAGDVVLDAAIAGSPWVSVRVSYAGSTLAATITAWVNRR